MFYITKLNVFYLFCFFIIFNKSIGQSRFDSIIKHSKRASTHKLKFIAADFKSSSVINGDSTKSETYVIFERLGPT